MSGGTKSPAVLLDGPRKSERGACSTRNASAYGWRQPANIQEAHAREKLCGVCGRPFVPQWPDQPCCSIPCAFAWQRGRYVRWRRLHNLPVLDELNCRHEAALAELKKLRAQVAGLEAELARARAELTELAAPLEPAPQVPRRLLTCLRKSERGASAPGDPSGSPGQKQADSLAGCEAPGRMVERSSTNLSDGAPANIEENAPAKKPRYSVARGGWAQAGDVAAAKAAREMRNRGLPPEVYAPRACHDCGRPTYNYRCEACLARWRQRHGVSEYVVNQAGQELLDL